MQQSLFRILFTSVLLVIFSSCEENKSLEGTEISSAGVGQINEIPPEPEVDSYGFSVDDFEIIEDEIKRNESLYIILDRHGVSPRQIYDIDIAASDIVNLNRMIPGQSYSIYRSNDNEVTGMVWNMNAVEYVVIDWREVDNVAVTREKRELTTRETSATGTIQYSLYETLLDEDLPILLGSELAEILAWEVNFFRLQRDDSFKVIYEEQYVEDQFYSLGKVLAVEFNHWGRTYNAYYYENGDRSGYFDEEGESMQKALLQAPFRYSQRISSGFSHNRLHPIANVRRPHYGVDYAAPTGTPIIAAGDGVVTEAQYRGGNGNIVQIEHNSVYKTAYLHLSRFASGIRPGARVTQGQVIGYVGATGLATGPHLCYRLYINGSPVNSVTVELPASESLEEQYMADFQLQRRMLEERLNDVSSDRPYVTINNVVNVSGRN